jgi:hypothetical protein
MGLFMYSSNSRTYFSCAQRNLHPPQVEASSGSIAVRKDSSGQLPSSRHGSSHYTLRRLNEAARAADATRVGRLNSPASPA